MSKPNLDDFNNTYLLEEGDITTNRHALQTEATFNSCAPFTKYITNIGGSTINDAEALDLVMLMFDFLKYSSNYSGTTGSHSMILFQSWSNLF